MRLLSVPPQMHPSHRDVAYAEQMCRGKLFYPDRIVVKGRAVNGDGEDSLKFDMQNVMDCGLGRRSLVGNPLLMQSLNLLRVQGHMSGPVSRSRRVWRSR